MQRYDFIYDPLFYSESLNSDSIRSMVIKTFTVFLSQGIDHRHQPK